MSELTRPLKTISNIHHAAYGCRDAEQTIWFYTDILGLKLAAAFSSENEPGNGAENPFLHIFFEMGDGNYVAFFDAPETIDNEWLERKHSFNLHLAFEVESEAAMLEWQAYINSRGKSCLGPVDHGFVKSVYMYDPNGIQVEITARVDRYAELMDKELAESQHNLAQWQQRKRAFKEQKFGAEALDKRAG
ncbi:MAG: VOC family protein [Parahaliea sp.]